MVKIPIEIFQKLENKSVRIVLNNRFYYNSVKYRLREGFLEIADIDGNTIYVDLDSIVLISEAKK